MSTIAQPKNLVVVVIDRLNAGFIGAYGNTWIHTPNFDRLAAAGFLFDRATIDSPDLELLYRSYWSGRHALATPSATGNVAASSAVDCLSLLPGYTLALTTDERWLAEHRLASQFAQRELSAPSTGSRRADEADDTDLARLFAAAGEQLATLSQPFCLWLHVGALGQRWDAPLEFGGQYGDDDDPLPQESAAVPNRRLPEDFDPDELLAHVHSYAGQVSLLDMCLGGLLDALAEHPAADSTLLSVLSARGFPLGEHGRLGPCDEALYSELTQMPWILRFPDGRGASDRTPALVQPPDVHATLLDWCGFPPAELGPPAARGRSVLPLVAGTVAEVRDRACITGGLHESAIVTPAWQQRMCGEPRAEQLPPASANEPSIELFAKPDDRFEVNEISNRAVDVAAELSIAFAQFEQSCQSPAATDPPPLPETLVSGID